MAHSERIHTGVLHGCSENAHRRVFLVNETSEDSCESEVEYPLTPPLSESSGSRSHSPEHATFPADLNIITMVHLSRLRKRRNVAVRRQPKRKGVSSASSKLTLHVVSRASGKPAIVSASRSLLQSYVSGASMPDDTMPSRFPYNLTVSKLAMVLEGQIRQSSSLIECSEL
jgi:dehydrodolichyl diphosphate syntase complex subunit NUS1